MLNLTFGEFLEVEEWLEEIVRASAQEENENVCITTDIYPSDLKDHVSMILGY